MKIYFTPEVYVKLFKISQIVGGREFSGYGFVEITDDKDFLVYDVELLDVGNGGWTEFDSRKILEIMKRPDANKMKLWFHRHPLGNGIPGKHNWSGTDEHTCTKEPLGSIDPSQVGWALAAVATPGGWVGRIDVFRDTVATRHIPVDVMVDKDILVKAEQLLQEQIKSEEVESIECDDDDMEAYVDAALEIADEMYERYFSGEDYDIVLENLEFCEQVVDSFGDVPELKSKIGRLKRKVKRVPIR